MTYSRGQGTKVDFPTYPSGDTREPPMSLIVLKVAHSLNRWAVMHNHVTVATFATKPEADRAALAIAVHHPKRDTVEVDFASSGETPGEVRVF